MYSTEPPVKRFLIRFTWGHSVPISYLFRIKPQSLSLSLVQRATHHHSSSFFLPSSSAAAAAAMHTSSIPPSMALCISHGGGGGTISKTHHLSLNPHLLNNSPSVSISSLTNRRSSSHVTAAKRFSSKTNRLDGRNKKNVGGGMTAITKEDEILEKERRERDAEEAKNKVASVGGEEIDDGYFLPDLPGDKPDFWEGPQWDGFGFFIQYLWAFGVVFAVIACGIAVTTYNEGASDFKKTPVYQEAIQSRELLEEPETSESDVFEGNPTEEAPSLE